tara:strand:+ start:601 stop:924 length:324 start_codon:yes stop_codon:yes gene_type:complete
MTIQRENIIYQLYSNVAVIYKNGETYTAKDISGNVVSIDLDAVETEFAKQDYINKRTVGVSTTVYPGMAEQLDQLYHDMKDGKLGAAATTGSWYVGITSVKTLYPKP